MAGRSAGSSSRIWRICPPCVEFLAQLRATGRCLKMLKPARSRAKLAETVLKFVQASGRDEKD